MIKYAIYPASNSLALFKALDWHFRALDAKPSKIDDADIILCTDITQKHTLPRSAQNRVINIDKLMARDMAGDINRAILAALPSGHLADEEHWLRHSDWRKNLSKKTKVNVYAPGPSGVLSNEADSATIITGGAMVASAIENGIQVDAIVISDSLALTGYGSGAKALRAQIQKCGCALFTTRANAAVLAPHWPEELLHLLIGIRESFHSKAGNSLAKNFSSFPTGNVLTALILPVAASLELPIMLYGFEGALGAKKGENASLAHQNTHTQNQYKLDIWRTHFGSGYLFADEYLGALKADVNRHIHAYQSSGISISAPNWSLEPAAPVNNSQAKLYAGAAYADTHPVVSASIAAVISTGLVFLGLQIMTNLHWLILGIAAIGAFAFVLGMIHLRTRSKRLADLAERRASEKFQRAFEATNQRLDALEAKLDK